MNFFSETNLDSNRKKLVHTKDHNTWTLDLQLNIPPTILERGCMNEKRGETVDLFYQLAPPKSGANPATNQNVPTRVLYWQWMTTHSIMYNTQQQEGYGGIMYTHQLQIGI